MFSKTTIPNSYKTGSQSPLDVKGYFKDLNDLKDISNSRPLSWYKNMTAINMETGEEYIWKESSEGIIQNGYTYPDNVVSFEIIYSLKVYNFVKKEQKLESFIIVDTTLGKWKNGDTVPEHSSSNERWMDAGRKRNPPIFTLPKANISASVMPNSTSEVGTILNNVLFTASLDINDGGAANNYKILFGVNEVLNDTVLNTKTAESLSLGLTPIVVKSIISYDEGTVPKNDSLGTSVPNTIIAGSGNSGNLTYKGYIALFYGNSATKLITSTSIRTLTKRLENEASTFILNTGSVNKIFQLWLPTGKNLISVIDLDALNVNITVSYISESLSVNDVGGNSVAGTLYTMEQSVPYSTNHRHQITIS